MDGAFVCGSKASTGKVRPSLLLDSSKTPEEGISRETSSEKECTLPEVKPHLHTKVFDIPEDSNSPLLTPKGFVMPSGTSSPYVQKMGPFPPPPNPVEVGVPAMMSSTRPNQTHADSTEPLGSSPENDPWMISKLLRDTPPPTMRTPDRSLSSVKEKNAQSFEKYGYAFWNQTPEGYRRIKKTQSDIGGSHITEAVQSFPKLYSEMPPPAVPPPPLRFVTPPANNLFDVSGTRTNGFDMLDRSQRLVADNFIDLHITNIDQSIQPNEMKRILAMTFSQQIEVVQVLIHYLADGTYTACVRVANQQAAQLAISNFHRRKIGKKRIMISYFHNQGKPSALLRSEVKSLLAEVPNCRLPLFRFREVFERRYNTSISVSDLYRMRDIVAITDGNGSGRMISLTKESRMSPSNAGEIPEGHHSSVCQEHFEASKEFSGGWAEREAKFDLPNVLISLKDFEPKIKALIESHNGMLYLNSLPDCYKATYGPLPIAEDSQGVPLEHLVTRIRGVRLVRVPSTGVKHLENVDTQEKDDSIGNMPPKPAPGTLANELELLSREVIDLLRNHPCCRIPFSKFVPSYHRHYGKQCRVASYGFTRLIDLLEAISHVVQVLGEGSKQQLTLTAAAQVKRFSSDLLRLLKSQPGKQVEFSQLSVIYEKTHARSFNPCNYGVCFLDDLLADLADTIVVSGSEENRVISLPKREQTPEEIERTKQFAAETIELLSHAPEFRINFNKFIPAYHHHFGRQCKVADHGFTKLIDLFEAIPEAVQVADCGDNDRWLQLTTKEQLRVLGNQLTTLIKMTKTHTLYLSELPELYCHVYGYRLRPESYEVESLEDVCELLAAVVKVIDTTAGRAILLVDKSHLGSLCSAVRAILGGKPDGRMNLDALLEELEKLAGAVVSVKAVTEGMEDVLKISLDDNVAELTPIELLRRNIVTLLKSNEGRLLLTSFEKAYLNLFGIPCRPAVYGFVSVSALLSSLPEVVFFRNKGQMKTIYLKFEAEKMYSEAPAVAAEKADVVQVPSGEDAESKAEVEKAFSAGKGHGHRRVQSYARPFLPKNTNSCKDLRFAFANAGSCDTHDIPQLAIPAPPATGMNAVIPYTPPGPCVPRPPFIQNSQIATYPWSLQLGLNFQLGMHGTTTFPPAFLATPQPNVFMVSNVPQLFPDPNSSVVHASSSNADSCTAFPFPVAYACDNANPPT